MHVCYYLLVFLSVLPWAPAWCEQVPVPASWYWDSALGWYSSTPGKVQYINIPTEVYNARVRDYPGGSTDIRAGGNQDAFGNIGWAVYLHPGDKVGDLWTKHGANIKWRVGTRTVTEPLKCVRYSAAWMQYGNWTSPCIPYEDTSPTRCHIKSGDIKLDHGVAFSEVIPAAQSLISIYCNRVTEAVISIPDWGDTVPLGRGYIKLSLSEGALGQPMKFWKGTSDILLTSQAVGVGHGVWSLSAVLLVKVI